VTSALPVANIGPRGRRRRFGLGLIALGSGAILAAALMAVAVPRGWRLVVFLPLWVAALGVFQARDKT